MEDRVNSAISLFGDENAGGIVLLKPYHEYFTEYQERLSELFQRFPLGEEILGEAAEKGFITLFGKVLRLLNILTCFDEFEEDNPLSDRDEQDYRSIYVDLYDKWRKDPVEPKIINDDLVFEIELMKTVDINIDYILMLVQKYRDSHCDYKVILADIKRAIGATPSLRNKRDLIDAFIHSINSSDNVTDDWKSYIAEAKESELVSIIEEEALDETKTRVFIDRAFSEGKVSEVGTEIAELMTKKPSRFVPQNAYTEMKQRVLEKLKAFFERFSGLVG